MNKAKEFAQEILDIRARRESGRIAAARIAPLRIVHEQYASRISSGKTIGGSK
jgi:hypothetical protein